MPRKKPINPFYLLLLVAGAAFAITAMAYGVMTVRSLHASRVAGFGPVEASDAVPASEPTRFDELIDRYGAHVMLAELVLLTIGTVGAIGYDQYLDRKEAAAQIHPADHHPSDSKEGL